MNRYHLLADSDFPKSDLDELSAGRSPPGRRSSFADHIGVSFRLRGAIGIDGSSTVSPITEA